jgi:hypothetical protein
MYQLTYINEDGEYVTEKYDDFGEAIEQYALACDGCTLAILADTRNREIISQYKYEEEGSCALS